MVVQKFPPFQRGHGLYMMSGRHTNSFLRFLLLKEKENSFFHTFHSQILLCIEINRAGLLYKAMITFLLLLF